MQVQYHEFAASVEDAATSMAAGGKTGYAPCPKGAPEWIKNGGPTLGKPTKFEVRDGKF
jgi:multiple sugar transport system substrate-binding protein